MKIVILGKVHRLEFSNIDLENSNSKVAEIERQQKQCYRRRLLELANQHEVQFIGEEMDSAVLIPEVDANRTFWAAVAEELGHHPVASGEPNGVIGKQVAQELGCEYAEIDMPLSVRKEKGIPRDYSLESNPYGANKTAQWNQERERYMFDQILAKAGGCQRILIICGYKRVQAQRGSW